MESANRREVISQRFTVAPFESLTEFFDGFADDLFGLLYFHDCSPVSGASCPLHQTARGQRPETENEANRLVCPSRNGSHAGVTQTFRGAKRASGDRRREGLLAGTRQSQSGEKRRAGPIFARQKDTRRRIWHGFGRRQFERLKRFSQHGCIFLSVIAVPTFPQCKGAAWIIWTSGFAVR